MSVTHINKSITSAQRDELNDLCKRDRIIYLRKINFSNWCDKQCALIELGTVKANFFAPYIKICKNMNSVILLSWLIECWEKNEYENFLIPMIQIYQATSLTEKEYRSALRELCRSKFIEDWGGTETQIVITVNFDHIWKTLLDAGYEPYYQIPAANT